MSDTNPSLYERIGGKSAINTIVNVFCGKMQDDYRINRFFKTVEQHEQAEALKALTIAFCDGIYHSEEEITALLDNFFMTAFARDKSKTAVTGADWGFFGYIIAQDHPSTKYLCDSHSQLLRFMPDDSFYDAIMENLAASLQQLKIDNALQNEILALAERARDPILGK